eukprot:366263-Chlamydomonas_euryale.AAC.1
MSRIIARRELRAMVEDKLTRIVERLHDKVEEKHASEKRAHIKYGCCKQERDEMCVENKELKHESRVSPTCPVCRVELAYHNVAMRALP